MSFGSGGFGGFGSGNNNNSQQSGGFGFGSGNTTSGGFGQTQNTGFGNTANPPSGGLFGSGGTTATGGFGSSNNNNTGGFGGVTKPTFGSSTPSSGGLFGGTTATANNTSFGGGFGTNNANSGTAFGGANTSTGGGLFGASKPTFGGTAPGTGGGLFGNNTSTTGFGSGNTSTHTLFGGGQGTALGGNTADCQGTAVQPFTPFTEKESNNSNITNHYQSISFMQPYLKFSFEELRLADYNQGRRYGNASGQAGAFGTSTGFGGFGQQNNQNTGTAFGSTGGGLFGSSGTTSSGGFGSTTQTTGGFGSTGGGLFGPKPASGGIFGGTNNTTTSQPSGGLFGTTGTAGFGNQQQSTGFGNTQTAGGGLFGQNNQPKTGLFGQQTSNNASGGLFGNTAGSGGFGTNSGSLFNTNNQNQNQTQQNTGNSLFGNQQQQTSASNPFASNTSTSFGGGFGSNVNNNKPGLFNNTNTGATGGGLFNNTNTQNNQQQSSGVFGDTNNNNNNSGGGLFGQKPAAGGFGNQTNNTTGGGLFNQGQQNQSTGLFGNNQAQQRSSMFGSGNTGSGLLGGANNQGGTNSLFGGQNTNQQNSGGSLFGNNNNNNSNNNMSSSFGPQPNTLQPPQAFTASINDPIPYGSASIFHGLPPPPQFNPGPIATPITSGHKTRKPAVLPQSKLNPSISSRLITPQKRGGFGFSYSTYGTPSSASSVSSTPGTLTNSLLGSSIGRSLGKSFSTSNLRRTYDGDSESIMAPGAFSASNSRYSTSGSMRRLTIDRSLKTDLFSTPTVSGQSSPDKYDSGRTPSILKKKVSFDATTVGGNGNTNGLTNGVSDNSPTPSAQEQGYLRSSTAPRANGRANGSNGATAQSQLEMSQVKGNELAIVHEDDSQELTRGPPASRLRQDQSDPEPGRYWIKPSIPELKKMSRDQLKQLSGVQIGREHCGFCAFDEPVDMTTVDLDNIFGTIAVISVRSLTIYPKDVRKPPVGKGLNVPSIITMANSWPRKRDKRTPSYETSGARFDKHVGRLSRHDGTEFIRYDKETGEWIFRVPHFTTYALDYDDDDDQSMAESMQSGILSEVLPSSQLSTPKAQFGGMLSKSSVQGSSVFAEDDTQASSEPEDTFEFKKKRLFPGAFDDLPAFDDDREMEEVKEDGQSFLGDRSVVSGSEEEDEPSEQEEADVVENQSLIVRDMDVDMVGSFPGLDSPPDTFPKSILKATRSGDNELGTPRKPGVTLGDDWTEQLQRTISPRKQDRQALRASQALLFRVQNFDVPDLARGSKPKTDTGEIATSIDLMNSLFGKEEARRSVVGTRKQNGSYKGFESTNWLPKIWPYPKKPRTNYQTDMNEADRNFHDSFKPTWGPGNLLVHATHNRTSQIPPGPGYIEPMRSQIHFSNFVIASDITPENFSKQRNQTRISVVKDVPFAEHIPTPFDTEYPGTISAHSQEQLVWELAQILFDTYDDKISETVPFQQRDSYDQRIRKDRLSTFWSHLCHDEALAAVAMAQTAEERALAYLSMNAVVEACYALTEGRDYRLATLIAQIGGDKIMQEEMRGQIDSWRRLNVLSEMSNPIRALYELLAGNTCVCEGKKGPLEDRAATFTISERFSMDWKRAFGLKLWYATLVDEPLEVAIEKFAADLQGEEPVKPLPWFLSDQKTTLTWSDPHSETRQDVLWGVLNLYAQRTSPNRTGNLIQVIMPENVVGNPLKTRLSFELYHALSPHFPSSRSSLAADQLALSFASELDSANQWLWSLFVLLHLSSSPTHRQLALQSHLAKHAASIPEHDHDLLRTLFSDFCIPESWVWEAKALHARAVLRDRESEVRFLLKARNWTEAHRVLCEAVAPQAIVKRDHEGLRGLLGGFSYEERPADWRVGGGIYVDYLHLVKSEDGEKRDEGDRKKVVGRLVRGLGDMKRKIEGKGKESLLQNVAIEDMSGVVAGWVLGEKENEKERSWVLQLPLTGEMKRDRARELSLGHYRKVMAMEG